MRRVALGLANGIAQQINQYRVARSSRLRSSMQGASYTGASADWEFRNEYDYYRIIAMARFCDQNDKLVGQGVTRAVNLTFKTGLKYDAATGDDSLDDDLRARWCAWADDPRQCDARGRSTLDELAKLAYRHVVVDGDHIVLPTSNRSLQCVEGHRLVTPTSLRNVNGSAHCGVKKDEYGRPTEYWFSKADEGINSQGLGQSGIHRYPAYDRVGNPQVFHLFKPDRVSQTRGVSAFVRLIDNAMAHDDLQWAMLIKEQAAACVTFFREVESAAGLPMGGAAAFGGVTTETLYDGTSRTVHDISPGLEIQGRPGEKLTAFNPNLPGDGFLKHSMQVLTFISVNLGIPVMVLLLDPSATNFSGWRGAMDIAKTGFADTRGWMTTQFFRPVYLWWLWGEIARDPALRAMVNRSGVNVFGHQFTAPFDNYIDPSKDATADETIVRAKLDSRRNLLARRGLNIDEVDDDIVDDRARYVLRCHEAEKKIKSKFPESDVTWRDIDEVGPSQGSAPAPVPTKAALKGNAEPTEPEDAEEAHTEEEEPATDA